MEVTFTKEQVEQLKSYFINVLGVSPDIVNEMSVGEMINNLIERL